MPKVLITQVPPGEAPDWVRQAWVGLELPFENPRPGGYIGGVLSGKPVERNGYHVNPVVALEILQKKNPRAANWWRDNTPIEAFDSLVFDASACSVID